MNGTSNVEREMSADPWECVIVGGGAAGLSAALVLGRARRRILVVDAGEQSNRPAEGIGGLLGHDRRPPDELFRVGRAELSAYPSVVFRAARVAAAVDRGTTFDVELDDGSREPTRTLLLATGMDYELPDIPGVRERWGGSVFHCPFCHGWEVRDRRLGVLDRSDRVVERAVLLRSWSDDVTVYADGPLELDPHDRGRLARAGIAVDERVVAGLRGSGQRLDAIAFDDGSERGCEALLVPSPLRQRSPLAADLGVGVVDPSSPRGPLAVDRMFRTSVPRVYAAGDAAGDALPSVASAVAAGATAGKAIVSDLVAELLEV
ncbi:MAG TPA: NAD(P)/FAD-dependent oxidoreductase [Actinomycetota bacterium]|nr:NAD(P)/FAD-dependent oxidoreductase [Actinomycetota bacterium]